MEEKQILESDIITESDLPVLKLKRVGENILKGAYYYAKYFSIIAGNKQRCGDQLFLNNNKDLYYLMRNTRQGYERIAPTLKTSIIDLDNLKLSKEVPSMFKIGFAELDSEPFKVNEIDNALYHLKINGKIKGVADIYLNYALACAISDIFYGRRSNAEDLLDISSHYRKKDGDRRNTLFSFRSNGQKEHVWMPRSMDFPFYISTKVAVWLP